MGTTIERNYGYNHEVNSTKQLDWTGGGGGGTMLKIDGTKHLKFEKTGEFVTVFPSLT